MRLWELSVTEELAAMLAGGWVSVLLFRRCAMATLNKLFGINLTVTPGALQVLVWCLCLLM